MIEPWLTYELVPHVPSKEDDIAATATEMRSSRDALTRVEFINRVDSELVPFEFDLNAICYLHIDRLQRFNRINGVERGDEVMADIAAFLNEISVNELAARHAGDAFVFVVPNWMADGIAPQIANLLPITEELDQLKIMVGSCATRRPMVAKDCIDRARFACEALFKTGGIYRRFDEELQITFDKRAYVIDHLDDAIGRQEIRAWAQPIVRVLTRKVCEVEVLARWESQPFGMLRPDEFIPQLESHGLIHKLDLEVFRIACEHWCLMRDIGMQVPFGINLSRLDFELCDIYGNMRAIMDRYGVPVDQVHVEVTESSEAHRGDVVLRGLRRFHEAGFSTYMDDFGTGYSSLGTMADLKFDVIKIDKSFVDRITVNERARSVLADTVSMVKRLGMQTLCEGVESEEQFNFLRAIGCEKAQGYYFSRPISQDRVMELLAEGPSQHEADNDDAYLDAIGQVNLLDGTSAATHGVEAATIYGNNPISILEVTGQTSRLLTCNMAYERLLNHMGFAVYDDFVNYLLHNARSVHARALEAARLSRETGEDQQFDFILQNTYCSVTIKLIAQHDDSCAFLNIITSIDNAPQITEKTLLTGILSNPDRKYFWKDNDRRFLGANQAFLDYYDFPGLETILGKNDEDMGWHVDNDPFRNDELRVLQGETIEGAHGICESKGQMRRIVANKRPLYSNGAIVGLVGYFEDMGPIQGDETSW